VGQRAVSDGEIVRLAWEAEDRVRAGASCLAQRKLARRGELYLSRFKLSGALVWTLVARRWRAFKGGWLRSGEDVYDFADGDAAWRAAIGWDGKGEPEGFARYRRRA
jgi:hypothetical protein